jgi:hypothetical protein
MTGPCVADRRQYALLRASCVIENHDANMHDMMNMGWGMGIACLFVLAFVILGIAALVKYLFFR